MRDELVCQTLKEKQPGPIHEGPGRDVEDLSEVWDIFDSFYARPELYICVAKALEPIFKFR